MIGIILIVVCISMICLAAGVVGLLIRFIAGFFTHEWRVDQASDYAANGKWGM